MPINNDLPDKKFPMLFKWGENPNTKFMEALYAIKVEAVDSPDRHKVLSYLPRYSLATSEDHPVGTYSFSEQKQALDDLFAFKLLPSAMETIRFTFLISNIDLVDVTHLIRHRAMSFSAHCSGDRDMRHDDVLMKASIIDSEFSERYTELLKDAKDLYADMIDSKEISLVDARTCLPRSLANHYYASVSLKDLIPYFKQRLDRQIQPESDNIVALKMLIEVAKVFPEIGSLIDLEAPDMYYINTCPTDHSTNLYQPEAKNDLFEWKPQWFIYDKQRSDMSGGETFMSLWSCLCQEYWDLTAESQQEELDL